MVLPVKLHHNAPSVDEYARNVAILANLETIRVNQFIPFNLHIQKTSGSDTTSQYLFTEVFKPGYIYIVVSICGMNNTDGAHQLKLGIRDGVTDFVYESATVSAAGDSVEYVGQLMAKETDKIFAEFRSIGASDEIHLFVNGYKIRK